MKKFFALLMILAGAAGLRAGEFVEKFAGDNLSPQDWMVTYAVRCGGIDYRRPLRGKLVIDGLKKAKSQDAVAFLDRDADFTAGNFRLTARLAAEPAGEGAGSWSFQLLTENGELLLGATLETNHGKVVLSGMRGHSCTTLKNTPLPVAEPRGVLEIVRKKGIYQVFFNGKMAYEANGDTAAAASFRLQVAGKPGVLTLEGLSLQNIR